MQSRLKSYARKVQDPGFEDAIVMLRSGKESQLTINQRKAVAHLATDPKSTSTDEAGKLLSLQRARKRC